MTVLRTGLIQLTASDDPEANIPETLALIREAHDQGAGFILTPEVTNCVSASRERQLSVLRHEAQDPTLAALAAEAQALGVWLLIGSLALKTDDADGRFANRSFLLTPDGKIAARYDKIHMFDVQVSETETYRESEGFRPGNRAVLTEMNGTKIGMTVCYDVRFPRLYRDLAQAGAEILTVPAAFSPVTGAAHWESLLRARAIECGAYVLAPAQTGTHPASAGRPRRTHGHTLAVSPWGEILVDGGDMPGVTMVDLDLAEVRECRQRVPSLRHDRSYQGPDE